MAVGGLDPCAGAGVLADVRAMATAGAWPAAVVAVQTVQSTEGVTKLGAVPATQCVELSLWAAQLSVLQRDLDVWALKTGALGSLPAAQQLREHLAEVAGGALVVDPVMRPSRAQPEVNLAGGRAVEGMRMLAEAATLITPNLPEAEQLLGRSIRGEAQAREAATALLQLGCRAVLLKGGHAAAGGSQLVDWLATSAGVKPLPHQRLAVGEVHGTGCVLASLIAGRLAMRQHAAVSDEAIEEAVRWGLSTFVGWLAAPVAVGRGMRVLAPPPHEESS